MTGLLRETAGDASEHGHHRDALRTLHQAEGRLGETERRLPLFGAGNASMEARSQVEREREALVATREAVLSRLRARP